ncbi:hypothetical protein ONZ45_g1411 [Pleurotus djamor]|nr:hypothetical protein ONZ45_g1411 [Pleurotus djamor]
MLKLIALCATFLVALNSASVLNVDALTACNCRKQVNGVNIGNSFTLTQVTSAYNQGRTYQANNQQVGSRRYPHNFGNREGLVWPQACTAPFQEFPILPTRVYTGVPNDPGAERIVWDRSGNFCGCMTHNGVPGNSFQLC